jgi:hypothetical protein
MYISLHPAGCITQDSPGASRRVFPAGSIAAFSKFTKFPEIPEIAEIQKSPAHLTIFAPADFFRAPENTRFQLIVNFPARFCLVAFAHTPPNFTRGQKDFRRSFLIFAALV